MTHAQIIDDLEHLIPFEVASEPPLFITVKLPDHRTVWFSKNDSTPAGHTWLGLVLPTDLDSTTTEVALDVIETSCIPRRSNAAMIALALAATVTQYDQHSADAPPRTMRREARPSYVRSENASEASPP